VGLFRPARRITCANGDYWELYVSKTALPSWTGSDFDDELGWDGTVLGVLPALAATMWTSLIRPLGRALLLLPVAVVRGRRSRAVRIEAVTTFPRRQVLLWTTTDAHRDRVLDEIASGLAQGKIVRPAGAVYTGAE
jgi:membrane-associated phospholipid phosphatase